MRTIQSGSRTSTVVRAIAGLECIAKTLFLLAYVDDEAYRRRILVQLKRGEGRHRLARAVFHDQRGELRQRYREGQEDQLGALVSSSMPSFAGTRATSNER
jgi:TnpA family transposase